MEVTPKATTVLCRAPQQQLPDPLRLFVRAALKQLPQLFLLSLQHWIRDSTWLLLNQRLRKMGRTQVEIFYLKVYLIQNNPFVWRYDPLKVSEFFSKVEILNYHCSIVAGFKLFFPSFFSATECLKMNDFMVPFFTFQFFCFTIINLSCSAAFQIFFPPLVNLKDRMKY